MDGSTPTAAPAAANKTAAAVSENKTLAVPNNQDGPKDGHHRRQSTLKSLLQQFRFPGTSAKVRSRTASDSAPKMVQIKPAIDQSADSINQTVTSRLLPSTDSIVLSLSSMAIDNACHRQRSSTSCMDQRIFAIGETGRKRSSTSTGGVLRTTHVLQNSSIFKADPRDRLPDKLTVMQSVVEDDGGDRNDDLGPRPKSRERRLTIAADPVVHHRSPSIGNFMPFSRHRKTVEETEPMELSRLHVPHRWLSLRNVMAFFNILILIAAIAIVAIVSFYAGTESTRNAVGAMSSIAVGDISMKLDDILGNAEMATGYMQTLFSLPDNNVTSTARALRNLYNLMVQTDFAFDQIYLVDRLSNYAGVALDRDTLDESGNTVNTSTLLVQYLNITTKPYRPTFRVSSACRVNNDTCFMSALSGKLIAVRNVTYNARALTIFNLSSQRNDSGWTPIYQYMKQDILGMTRYAPVLRRDNSVGFISGVDITLSSLSSYMEAMARLLSNGRNDNLLLFIVEPSTEYLVATSTDMPITDGRRRVEAWNASDPTIRRIYQTIIQHSRDQSLASIEWSLDDRPLTFSDGDGHVVIGRYRRDTDIDWIITAFIPFSTYSAEWSDLTVLAIPIVSSAVLALSTCCSVAITRAIGRPLNRLAQRMLYVADLNFDDTNSLNEINSGDGGGLPVHKKRLKQSGWEMVLPWKIKEVQYLSSAMSAMTSGLKSFSKYVPLDVVTLLVKMKREAALGVDEIPLTIYFSDIVNFTAIAESIPPNQLVQVMEYIHRCFMFN